MADHEAHYQAVAAFMAQVRAGKVRAYICDAVIAECVYVLTKFYGVPRREAAEQLSQLLAYRGMCGTQIGALREALKLFGESSLDFVDTLVVATALENGWEVESFDKKLLRHHRLK
ncbi:MAG: PIN domain-containing protein [Methylothermaceae bacterium]|nr:PIN domain-containing protein [Methylothermaceae bacterium]